MSESTGLISVDDSPEKRPRRRHGENRERLIVAGIVEFGHSGYHGASTASISAAAQVSQPHVYANFENKQQLFFACLARSLTTLGLMPEPPTSFATHSATSAPRNDQGDQHARLNAARMVFQACSCAFELREELPQLRELLHTTRRSLGTRGFQQLLSQAAESLMNEDA